MEDQDQKSIISLKSNNERVSRTSLREIVRRKVNSNSSTSSREQSDEEQSEHGQIEDYNHDYNHDGDYNHDEEYDEEEAYNHENQLLDIDNDQKDNLPDLNGIGNIDQNQNQGIDYDQENQDDQLDVDYNRENHSKGDYIKKLKEKFEQKKFDNLSSRQEMNNIEKTQSFHEFPAGEPCNSKKSKRSIITTKGYDDMMSQFDNESVATSHKTCRKKKKVRKVKITKSNISEEDTKPDDDNDDPDQIATNLQSPDAKSCKRVKVTRNKMIKKHPRKNIINSNISGRNSKNSVQRQIGRDINLKRNISFIVERLDADNEDEIKCYNMDDENKNNGNQLENSVTSRPAEYEGESLLKNLNLIVNMNDYNAENKGKDEIIPYHPRRLVDKNRYTNNYEMPTIASSMKKVDRTIYQRLSESSDNNRGPFVVGTSISMTNNLYLLKQQISSKINTYLLSSVNEDQLKGWNVNHLRLLIQSIEKFSGESYKLRNVNRMKKHIFNQQIEEGNYNNYNKNM